MAQTPSHVPVVVAVPRTPLQRLWVNLPAYRQCAALSQQIVFVYRANVAFYLISILAQVYLLKAVWTAIYAGRTSVDTLHLSTLIATLTLANLQLWVMSPDIGYIVYQRVREGQVAVDLARPVGFLGQMVAQQVGRTVGVVPFVVVAFPLAWLLGGLQSPASAPAFALYLIGVLLAYLIGVLLALLVGLISFWTLEMVGFLFVLTFVSQFFGGALVPLQFFPPALRTIATVLPFQAQAYLPLEIYLGQTRGGALAGALALQLFWVAVLAILTRWLWQRAVQRLVIQGG